MNDLAMGNTNFFKFNNNLFIKFLGIAQDRVLFVPRVRSPFLTTCLPLSVQSTHASGKFSSYAII